MSFKISSELPVDDSLPVTRSPWLWTSSSRNRASGVRVTAPGPWPGGHRRQAASLRPGLATSCQWRAAAATTVASESFPAERLGPAAPKGRSLSEVRDLAPGPSASHGLTVTRWAPAPLQATRPTGY